MGLLEGNISQPNHKFRNLVSAFEQLGRYHEWYCQGRHDCYHAQHQEGTGLTSGKWGMNLSRVLGTPSNQGFDLWTRVSLYFQHLRSLTPASYWTLPSGMETLWTKSCLAAFGSEMASSGLLLRLSTQRYGIWTDGSVLDSSACRNLWGKKR